MAARKNARRGPRRTDGSDTARDVLGWISDQVNFWSGGGEARPGEQQVVADARAATQSIVGTGLRVADAYYTGGTAGSFARNVAAPRATVASPTNRNQGIRAGGRQFARDAVVAAGSAAAGYGIGRGVVAGTRRFAPQFVGDVGVHFSKNPNIEGQIISDASRIGTGKGPSVRHPVLPGRTYKFSGVGPVLGSETRAGAVVPAKHYARLMSASDTAYVTASKLGRVDPESPALAMGPQVMDWFERGGMYQSQRVTGPQRIVETVRDRSMLADAVTRQRAILAAEQARTAGRAGVFGAGLGTAGQTTFVGKNGRRRNVR